MAKKPSLMDAALKVAIRKSGRTYYELGRAAGVAPSVILRFMSDDPQARGGDMRLSTAAKIAAELGLELLPKR
jgi:predicted transcriptional regulator